MTNYLREGVKLKAVELSDPILEYLREEFPQTKRKFYSEPHVVETISGHYLVLVSVKQEGRRLLFDFNLPKRYAEISVENGRVVGCKTHAKRKLSQQQLEKLLGCGGLQDASLHSPNAVYS